MSFSVIHNAKRNMVAGIINKTILMLCPFVERTAIRYWLGAEYLGLSSLFTSVLAVLSLSELGFSSAVVCSMYKPVAEGDAEKVNALLSFYRKAYRIIGLAILTLGVLVSPFLPQLIYGSHPADISIFKLYYIYLINTALSYLMFAYLTSILVVHQRDDINSFVTSIIKIALTCTQMLLLLLTKNYYLFAIMMPIFTVISNLFTAYLVKRNFPQYHCEGKISETEKKDIRKIVAGSFINRACQVTRNSLDSICVSAFLGLTLTAIYSNYYQIVHALIGITTIVNTAFMGGVGNHVVTKTVEENFEDLKRIDFAYLAMSGWMMVCMLCLYQPFMELWMGRDMMLPNSAMVLFCVYFYMLTLGDMRYMYMSAKGLFWEQRWRAIAETVMNLVLNIGLGKLFGVYGIVIATMISLFLCNYLWSNRIIFREFFGMSYLKKYYSYQGKYTAVTLLVCLAAYAVCSMAFIDSVILTLLFRAAVCMVLPALIYFFTYRKTAEFRYMTDKLLHKV